MFYFYQVSEVNGWVEDKMQKEQFIERVQNLTQVLYTFFYKK